MNGITLEKLLKLMNKVALDEKIVNYSLSATSPNALNNLTVDNYPMIMNIPSGAHIYRDETTTFSLDVFYLDRLNDGCENDIQIQSVGIEELKQYFRKLEDLEWVVGLNNEIYIEGFTETERKADRCGGAIARLQITVLNFSDCYID